MSIIVNKMGYVYNPETVYENRALSDINLKIEDGEMIGLVGHTGSGKSTLIQHLNGLLKATEGGIYYNGCDIYDDDFSLRELRNKVGLVFQYPEHQLFEETVFKDVCFGPINQGLSQKDAELKAYEALKQVGLSDKYFYMSPFELSGGEKRRVAIAGVLAMRPEVLILDEPTAGLDPGGRIEILNLLKKLHETTHITIIIVSHSMDEMAEYVNRLIVMDGGTIAYDDTPQEVFSHAEDLKRMGLTIPVALDVLITLAQRGKQVRPGKITIADVRDEIVSCYMKREK